MDYAWTLAELAMLENFDGDEPAPKAEIDLTPQTFMLCSEPFSS
ncbi:hypothetical protein [[Actinomadura] parvosata]